MEKFNKTAQRNKKRKVSKKYYCTLCERMVMRNKHIKVRKNFTHGKKSKPTITAEHRLDGGCLVEVKRKNEKRN